MKKIINAVFMTVVLSVLFSMGAYAAKGKTSTTPVLLGYGTEVSGYDLNLDGAADTVKILQQDYIFVQVYVNGKYIQTLEPAAARLVPSVYIIAPKKKSTYLAVRSDTTQTGYLELYRYKKGKFIKVYQASLGEEATAYPMPYKVSKNELTVKDTTGRFEENIFQSNAEFLVKYTLKGNKVKLKSRYAKIAGRKTFKVQYDYNTSSKKTVSNGKGVALKAGQTVEVIRMYISPSSSDQAYQVKANGKKGWIIMRHDNWPAPGLLY